MRETDSTSKQNFQAVKVVEDQTRRSMTRGAKQLSRFKQLEFRSDLEIGERPDADLSSRNAGKVVTLH